MKQSARLFIAAELTAGQVRELSVLAGKIKTTIPANYVSSKNYHLTLAFLGETLLGITEQVKACMVQAMRGYSPQKLALGEPGFFGRWQNAILWCGVSGAQQLVQYSERLRRALRQQGIHFDEKPMRPHITLARKANVEGVDLARYTPQPLAANPPAVTLFESTRLQGELVYIPVYRHVLK